MTQARSEVASNTCIGTGEPVNKCCDSPAHYETSKGLIVCRNCGLEIDNVKVSYQKRAFTPEERAERSHYEIMPLFHQGWKMRVIDKKGLSQKWSRDIWRLVKINNQQIGTNRASTQMMISLERFTSEIGLPRDVSITATMILKEVSRRKLSRGRSMKCLAAASVYEASKIQGFPLFIHELYDNYLTAKTLMSHIRVVRAVANDLFGTGRKHMNFEKQLLVLACRIGLRMDIALIARSIFVDMVRNGYNNTKDPRTIFSALVFVTCKVHSFPLDGKYVTQKLISRKTGITEVSLRSRVKDVLKYCKIPVVRNNVRTVTCSSAVLSNFKGIT